MCFFSHSSWAPILLHGKFHGLRSLVGYSPWGRKESDKTERLHSLTTLAGTSATGMEAKNIVNFHDLVLNKIKDETQYVS